MKLLRIEIENFGKLHRFTYEPGDGLNTICEENGWGKTTLAMFIKAMFYGLPASSRKKLDENDRRKYLPWQGGNFGGSLTMETEKGQFRVERFFGAKEADDSFRLTDLSTNLESHAYSEDIGAELFGIDADGFERSTYLSGRLPGSAENSSVKAKLTNLLEDVNDIGNYDIAAEILEKHRKFYQLTGNRGKIADLEADVNRAQIELADCKRARDTQETFEKELALHQQTLSQAETALKKISAELEQALLAKEQVALSDQKNAMLTSLAKKETRKREIQERFGGNPPESGAVADGHLILQNLQHDRAERQSRTLPDADRAELERLNEQLHGGIPETERERAQADEEGLRTAYARAQALREMTPTEPSRTFAGTGIPSEEAIDAAFDALNRAERLRGILNTSSGAKSASGNRPPLFPAGIGLGAIGLVLLLVGLVLRTAPLFLPCVIGGSALVLVGAVLLIVGLKNGSASDKKKIRTQNSVWQKDADEAERTVVSLLECYGIPAGDGDLRGGLNRLSRMAEQARNAEMQNSARAEQLAAAEREIQERQARLRAFLTYYGIPATQEIHEGLRVLSAKHTRLEQLKTADRNAAQSVALLTQRIADGERKLSAILDRFPGHVSQEPARILEEWNLLRAEYERLSREIREESDLLSDFIAKHPSLNAEQTATAGDVGDLRRQKQEQTEAVVALQRAVEEDRRKIDRLNDRTGQIPDLEDRIGRLEEEKKDAKEKLSAIRATAELLEAAKTSLSTRYLGGMQESFRKYLSMLTETDASRADLDVTFSVSMRDDGQSRELAYYSRGWRDMLQFCVRLSLTDALYAEGERPFLLLDDPFSNLDEERLAAAKKLLQKLSERYQILYLVCHADRT